MAERSTRHRVKKRIIAEEGRDWYANVELLFTSASRTSAYVFSVTNVELPTFVAWRMSNGYCKKPRETFPRERN